MHSFLFYIRSLRAQIWSAWLRFGSPVISAENDVDDETEVSCCAIQSAA